MARRRARNEIGVEIVGEADFGRARKDAKRDLAAIEDDAKDAAQDIEKAFDGVELSPELDSSEIREALDLARDLDGMVATFDVDTDLSEIQRAEKIARSLRSFQGRVDLSVEGRDELKDALNLAESMDQVRQVKVQVQGRQDLERARDLADDLGDSLVEAGEEGADGIRDAIGGIDFSEIGGSAVNSLTGALSAAGPWAAAAGTIAAVFADDLIGGISDGWGRNRQVMLDSLATGLPRNEVRQIGDEVGEAFVAGFGESLEELRQDSILLKDNLGDLPSGLDDQALIRYGAVAKQVFGVDIPEQVEITRRLIGAELAGSVEEAYQLMAANSQTFGLQAEENLDVLREYAPVFARVKLDGTEALGAIGEAARDGVFENTDMAADSLKEMLARLDALDSSDALAKLGLDIQAIQTGLQQGRVDEVLATIGDRLSTIESESQRVAVATEIFGSSIEGANIDEFAQWLLEIGENAPQATAGMEDMAAAVADSAGPWTKLGRAVRDTTGDFVAMFQETDLRGKSRPELREILGLGDDADIEEIESTLRSWRDLGLISAEQFDQLAASLYSFGEVPWTPMSRGLGDVADSAADVTDDFDGAARAVRSLEEEFARLEGRFDASSSLRRIEDQADSLLDSAAELEAGLFTAGGEFARADPAVRQFEQTLEDMNGTVNQAAQDLENNTITVDQFRVIQNNAAEAIRLAGEAAGLTDAQVAELIATYTRVPDRVQTDVEADTNRAHADLNRFLAAANSSRATVTLGADASYARAELNRFMAAAGRSSARVPVRGGGNATQRAHGGPVTGRFMVGEGGREILDIGSAQGFVHSNRATEREVAAGGASKVEIVLRLDTPLLRQILRRDVANVGGINAYFGER